VTDLRIWQEEEEEDMVKKCLN